MPLPTPAPQTLPREERRADSGRGGPPLCGHRVCSEHQPSLPAPPLPHLPSCHGPLCPSRPLSKHLLCTYCVSAHCQPRLGHKAVKDTPIWTHTACRRGCAGAWRREEVRAVGCACWCSQTTVPRPLALVSSQRRDVHFAVWRGLKPKRPQGSGGGPSLPAVAAGGCQHPWCSWVCCCIPPLCPSVSQGLSVCLSPHSILSAVSKFPSAHEDTRQ